MSAARHRELLIIGSQSSICLGDPLGSVTVNRSVDGFHGLGSLSLIQSTVHSTLHSVDRSLDAADLTLGIVNRVAKGLLDTEQLVEVLFKRIEVTLAAKLDSGSVHTGGITELEDTEVLRNFLTFRVLGCFGLVVIAVQICHAVNTSQGGLTENEELIAVLSDRKQTGGGRYIGQNILQAIDLSELFFLVLGALKGYEYFIPDLSTFLICAI